VNDLSDLVPQPEPSPQPAPRRFLLPAEYYDAPPGPPALPHGLKLGCGIASLVVLVLAFGGAVVLRSYGVNRIFAMTIDKSHDELKAMYAKDVPPAKRKEVDSAISGVSSDLAADRLQFVRLQPLLEQMKDAMEDKTITNAEADALLKSARDVRKPKEKKR
jgi:hypothetical protein